MQQLLESEGVVVDNQIIDFDHHFWQPPMTEL
jgi:methylated-DNA-protein-cysteine methyltransferase-like protein